MMVTARRHLWAVRDHQNLPVLRQPMQSCTDRLGYRATDTGINLVKYQRAAMPFCRQRHFQGQHEARQFTARSDFGNRPGRHAGIGRGDETNFINAVRRPVFQSDALNQGRKFAAIKFERRQFLIDHFIKTTGGGLTGLGNSMRRLLIGRVAFPHRRFQFRHTVIAAMNGAQFFIHIEQ